MKKFFILCVFLVPFVSEAQPRFGTDLLKNHTLEVIHRAVTGAQHPKLRRLFLRVYHGLKSSHILEASWGRNYRRCQVERGIVAYQKNEKQKSVIRLCSNFHSLSYLAQLQTLVHESIHTLGIYNECEVHRIELALLNMARLDRTLRTKYDRVCRRRL